MSTRFYYNNETFNIVIESFQIPPNSIQPSLRFIFRYNGNEGYCVTSQSVQVSLQTNKISYIGTLQLLEEIAQVSELGDIVQGTLHFTHSMLNEIEKLRENKDLLLKFQFKFVIKPIESICQLVNPQQQIVEYRIPKSDWVERWLPALHVKEVSLVEIPKLDSVGENNIIENLNTAWKQKQMGEYKSTLTNCRLVLEELRQVIQDKGHINTAKESSDKTDWKKFFESEAVGEIFDRIETQLHRFTSRGAHIGRAIDSQDADFALMITHACVNLVVKELINQN